MEIDIRQLFTEDGRDAYEQGASAELVRRRNGQLGNLLNAERGIFYAQILYGMLRFRREHELEPLHDDLYAAVQPAQEALIDDGEYDQDRFREDIASLKEWKLIEERIELQRLRGYRDSRRRKFRYSLSEESIAFLEWLEDRLQDDLEERSADTRDLLETVCGSLQELSRVLYRVHTKNTQEGDARRVLFQLGRLDQYTNSINEELTSLNARMYGFVMRHYTISEARQILQELEGFSKSFLRQIHILRDEITDKLGTIRGDTPLTKIRRCLDEMMAERREAPHLMRRMQDPASILRTPAMLHDFYREDGTLDLLCRRISATTTSVWRKLHLHLRELERKNHRLEDLRSRISEISALPADKVPADFLLELIAPAQIHTDAQYWDEDEMADPPQPRRESSRQAERARLPIPSKDRHQGPVRTLEQRQLAMLREWLDAKIITPAQADAIISDSRFYRFDDLVRVMELVKAGKLGKGRKLEMIDFLLDECDSRTDLEADGFRLSLPTLSVLRRNSNGRH